MRKTSLALLAAAVAGAFAVPAAAAEPNPWMVRVRALYLDPADKSEPVPALGVPANAITVSEKLFPEVDVSYFFTKHLAAELVLTYPQKHEVTVEKSVLGGPVKIGTFKHLPPTLTAQYHFTGLGGFRPYVGAGLNYTNISDVKWGATAQSLGLNLKRNSYGLAAQVGVDVPLAGGWLLNVDVKKVQIKTDVSSKGTKIGVFKVDPMLVSVGFGLRF